MTTTRQAIRQAAVDLVPKLGLASTDGATQLTATGGDARRLIDTVNLPSFMAALEFRRGWWLYLPDAAAADQVRQIAEFNPAEQALMIDGADYGVAPSSGDPYLILRDHPIAWNRAINYALTELCAFPRFDEFTPTDETASLYSITAAPISVSDIVRLSQIWGVQYHTATEASDEERWKDWYNGQRTVNPYEDEGTFYLDFGRGLGTSREFRLVSLHPFAALTDETTITNVENQWAALATIISMADANGDLDNPSDLWAEAGRKNRGRYEDRRRANLGKYAFRQVSRWTQQRGGYRVAGRAGRGGF